MNIAGGLANRVYSGIDSTKCIGGKLRKDHSWVFGCTGGSLGADLLEVAALAVNRLTR